MAESGGEEGGEAARRMSERSPVCHGRAELATVPFGRDKSLCPLSAGSSSRHLSYRIHSAAILSPKSLLMAKHERSPPEHHGPF